MTVFINYGSGQEHYVTHFQQLLDRIIGAKPTVAERRGAAGTRIDEKLKKMLNESKCMVSILTQTSISDGVWQNQEIGYFTAKNKPIIPIKDDGFQIKGFLDGIDYITLKPYDLDYNSYELIARIRDILNLNIFNMECQSCRKEFTGNIPSHRDIVRAIERNTYFNFSMSTMQSCCRCES
jgi:hypothetical protein